MAHPQSVPPPEWEITLQREVFKERSPLLRVLGPPGPLPDGIAAATLSLGGAVGTHGDRPALEVDPRALLARAGEFRLPEGFAGELERVLARHARSRFELPLPRGRRLVLGDPPAIFGIINATPDSFSDGGLHLDPDRAQEAALEMVRAGADALDVGGESTRPGAAPVGAEEERRRVEPVIRKIRQVSDIPLSIDTTKAEVAKMALNEGADIINDVSALGDDRDMVKVARETGAPVILMHRRGTPRDMQDDPRYDDVCREVYQFLARRLRELEDCGLDPERMVVDPGIGFGKRVEHNLALLRDLGELRSLGRPIMVGASRKSFLGKAQPPAREVSTLAAGAFPPQPPRGGGGGVSIPGREVSTLAAHAAAIAAGAAAVRVHDVPLHRDLVGILSAIARGSKSAGR